MNYGPYSNAELLGRYGFILPENSQNYLQVSSELFTVQPEDEMIEVKEKLLEKILSK
jgi:hypothetical protein